MRIDLVDETDVEEALERLTATDEDHAIAKAKVKALEQHIRRIRGLAYMAAPKDATVAEKNHLAECSDEVARWVEEYQNAWADLQLLENQRESDVRTYELYRTVCANKRQGG